MDEKCYKCGCLVTDGEPTEIFLGRFQHHHTIDCVYALQRRVAELEASREHFQMLWVSDGCKYAQFADDLIAALKIELPDEYEDDEDATLAVIVAKVAELEARVEQEWLPVTEKPTEAGYYQTVNDGLYEHCYYGPNGWEDYYLTPTHWRPLTDPPLTGES